MLHDVALHDVIGGHQAYIHRKIDIFMGHRILHLAKTTRGSHNARASARRNYKLSSREQLSGHWPQTARQLYHLVVAVAIIVDYA